MTTDCRLEGIISHARRPSLSHSLTLSLSHYRTQEKQQTVNPVWNESFIINAADGMHSAHLVQLLVKDHESGLTTGVVYIPIGDFFTRGLIKGELKWCLAMMWYHYISHTQTQSQA